MLIIKHFLFNWGPHWQQSPRRQIFWHLRERIQNQIHNHKNSFKCRRKEKDIELPKYIWELKDKSITNYSIKWSIVKQTYIYNNVTNSCNLCLSEKLEKNFRKNFRDKKPFDKQKYGFRVRSHERRNGLLPVWGFKPEWKQVLFTWNFASMHLNANKELTEHRREIFNRHEISCRFEFLSPLMWTYS